MKTSILSIIIAGTLTLPIIAHSQVQGGEITRQATIGSWQSFYVSDASEVRARMTTVSLSSPDTMVIDAFPPSCHLNMEWIFSYSSPLNHDTPERKLPTFLRIDSNEMHPLSSFYKGVMGDKAGIISLNTTPDFQSIMEEMVHGTTLRVKLELETGDELVTDVFPLNGFAASLNRIEQGCTALTSNSQEKHSPAGPPVLPPSSSVPHNAGAARLQSL